MRRTVGHMSLVTFAVWSLCVLLGASNGAELFGDAADAEMATFEFEVDLDAASKLKMSQYNA